MASIPSFICHPEALLSTKKGLKEFYKAKCVKDQGTLNNLQERIIRKNFNPDVVKSFDAVKDFILSVTRSYIAAAVLHHFGMQDEHSMPTRNTLPQDSSDEEKREWLQTNLRDLARQTCLPGMHGEVEGNQRM